MAVSIEGFLLVNFGMNLMVLSVVARCRGKVRWIPLCTGAFLGACYAALVQLPAFFALRHPIFRVLLTAGLVAVALRPSSAKDALCASGLLLAGSALLGGAQLAARELMTGNALAALLVGGGAGALMLMGLFRARTNRLEKWEVQVIARKEGRQVRFTALIDTGNRLHEPLSGLPVMIVEQAQVQRLLPGGFPGDALRPGFRRVAYGGVGGNGWMNVFRPDELLVNYSDGWMRAPELWVGVYPGHLPGGVTALAPALLGAVGSGVKRGA